MTCPEGVEILLAASCYRNRGSKGLIFLVKSIGCLFVCESLLKKIFYLNFSSLNLKGSVMFRSAVPRDQVRILTYRNGPL